LVDGSHLHEAHLLHLEDKTDASNKLLGDVLEAKIWFSSKINNGIEKKFQSVVHHHENVVKLAQHHWLAPGAKPLDIIDQILNHTLNLACKCNLVPFIN
jgi:hypothetical protein